MKRPTKKEIAAAVDKLKDKPNEAANQANQAEAGKLANKKDSKRIRKQGV
jgi:hypothetical protein